jgi:hypothetical protein
MDHEMSEDHVTDKLKKQMPLAKATDPAAEEKKKLKLQSLFKKFVS